jgi:hypothetical protein
VSAQAHYSNFTYLSPAETADSIAKGASPYHLEPGIVVKLSLSYAQQIRCSSSGRPYLVGLGDFPAGCCSLRLSRYRTPTGARDRR